MRPFYNTQHSPVGANSSFTLGMPGKSGGMGIGLTGPAMENFWIGYEEPATHTLLSLPFFEGATVSEEQRFGIESAPHSAWEWLSFTESQIIRHMDPGADSWHAGDLSFTIYTQVPKLEDPAVSDRTELRMGLIPGLFCDLTLDNSQGTDSKRVFLGWQGSHPQWAMQVMRSSEMVGISQGGQAGFFGAAVDGWMGALAFSPEEALERIRDTSLSQNRLWGLGTCGVLACEVPPGEVKTCTLAVAFYQNGPVTTGRPCRPWYNKWWNSLEDVAWEVLVNLKNLRKRAEQASALVAEWNQNPYRNWMLAQAIHSYYGSTQLLEELSCPDIPFWVVNEGEYRMLNTLDLTVDMVFFEMTFHPWAVRSVLEQFHKRYMYRDQMGVSFAHDMGVGGVLSPLGRSAYELAGRTGCFSFMTAEELLNYALCAISYARVGGDSPWLEKRHDLVVDIFTSLSHRCLDANNNQTGIIQNSTALCMGGAEITTFDSLDPSLGQATQNLYLAVKCWATWIGLYQVFERQGDDSTAATCWDNAILASQAIALSADSNGQLPALLDGSCTSMILPAIESLVFPAWWGDSKIVDIDGPFAPLIKALRRHTEVALESGKCLFPNGALRLSESSDNSWLSKIYLWQAVCENVFRWPSSALQAVDKLHCDWLLDPNNALYAWSDQMLNGKVCGSRYYPRGVTGILWSPQMWQF